MSKETQGNALSENPQGQTMKDGGKRTKDMGFGEEDSKATGSAGRGKPNSGKYCNTPDGQEMKG